MNVVRCMASLADQDGTDAPRPAPGGSGGLGPQDHLPGCAEARPTGGQPLVGVEPWEGPFQAEADLRDGLGTPSPPRRPLLVREYAASGFAVLQIYRVAAETLVR